MIFFSLSNTQESCVSLYYREEIKARVDYQLTPVPYMRRLGHLQHYHLWDIWKSLILVLLKFQFRLHSLLSNSFDYVFVEGDTKIAPCVIHACSFWGYSHNHIIILVVLSLCWTYSGGFSAKVWGHWPLLHTFAQASEKERHALSVAGEPLLSSFQHGQ